MAAEHFSITSGIVSFFDFAGNIFHRCCGTRGRGDTRIGHNSGYNSDVRIVTTRPDKLQSLLREAREALEARVVDEGRSAAETRALVRAAAAVESSREPSYESLRL